MQLNCKKKEMIYKLVMIVKDPVGISSQIFFGTICISIQKIRCGRFRNSESSECSECSKHIIIGGTIFVRGYFLKFKEMGGNTNKLQRKCRKSFVLL